MQANERKRKLKELARTSDIDRIQIEDGKCGGTYDENYHSLFLYAKLNCRLLDERDWSACLYLIGIDQQTQKIQD